MVIQILMHLKGIGKLYRYLVSSSPLTSCLIVGLGVKEEGEDPFEEDENEAKGVGDELSPEELG